jgi:K+ transporter
MRADNHGEGGILALLALISPRRAKEAISADRQILF